MEELPLPLVPEPNKKFLFLLGSGIQGKLSLRAVFLLCKLKERENQFYKRKTARRLGKDSSRSKSGTGGEEEGSEVNVIIISCDSEYLT